LFRPVGTTLAALFLQVASSCSHESTRPFYMQLIKGGPMCKYFLAWLLGVPAGLLVIIYLVMHM